jgi:hypothetical protein
VGISVLSAFRLELTKASEIGGKLLAIDEQARDAQMQLEAHGSLANILWLMGDFIGSRGHSEKGLALFALHEHLPSGKEHMRAACLTSASFSTAALGFPDQGLRRALKFLAWAKERAQPLPLAFALNSVATVSEWRREGDPRQLDLPGPTIRFAGSGRPDGGCVKWSEEELHGDGGAGQGVAEEANGRQEPGSGGSGSGHERAERAPMADGAVSVAGAQATLLADAV